MAKFRKNHGSSSKSNQFLIRGIVLSISLIIIVGFGVSKLNTWFNPSSESNSHVYSDRYNKSTNGERTFLPKGGKGEIIHHKYYSLAYNELNEQADWVAYHLTKKSLQIPNVKRSRQFRPDYDIKSRSAIHSDYTHSGYTRGHLAPAGDMAFSEEAMEESFIMSNMSPQIRTFNNGIWKELEETVRDWAYFYEDIYVVSGPIFQNNYSKKIGKNRVAVPDAFYKVILDNKNPYQKAIAFIIPHQKSDKKLAYYAVSVDELEEQIKLDFYDDLLQDDIEAKIESVVNLEDWPFDEKRYKLRINKWNNQN